MPRNNIFQTLTRQYNFAVELVAIWEISGLNVSRRPMALSETLHAVDAINTADTTFYFQKVLIFIKALCFKTVNIRRTNIMWK
jgi:hypothetical protein